MDALSCLAPPSALLASSFAADARALHFSMSDSASSSSTSSFSAPTQQQQHHSPLLADLAYYGSSAPAPHVTCESVLVADSPPRRSPPGGRARHQHHQQLVLAPAGARAGKRRSRASKRAPTTYISTNPANFRIMVQQITGLQADPADAAGVLHPMATAFDASVLLAADGAHPGAYGNPLLTPGEEAASLHQHQQQQQQPCFPTLDSWNVMYERNELL